MEPPSQVVAGVRTVTTNWQMRYTSTLLHLLYYFKTFLLLPDTPSKLNLIRHFFPMDDIRRQFQESSIEFIKKSLTELANQETVSSDFIQSLFRRIHTIKGSAQVFGLNNTSGLAHSLEDILALLRANSETECRRKKLFD